MTVDRFGTAINVGDDLLVAGRIVRDMGDGRLVLSLADGSPALVLAADCVEADSASGGVTDHGDLTGKSDDDHPHYHTDARGDARYYTQGQVDTSLAGKSDTGHGHVIADVTSLQSTLDGKAASSHTHSTADVPLLDLYLNTDATAITSNTNAIAGKADAAHTHGMADLTGIERAVVTTQVDVTNSTNYTTALTLSLEQSSTYSLRGVLLHQAPDGVDIKVRFNPPTGTSSWWVNDLDNQNVAPKTGTSGTIPDSTGNAQMMCIQGIVTTDGSTTGLLPLQIAQKVANASPSSLLVGSHLIATKLA